MLGITITDIWDKKLELKLKTLPKGVHARLVIDEPNEDYANAKKIISQYVSIIPQVCDSYVDGSLSSREYSEREDWIFKNFSDSEYVEISNEIGPETDWMSSQALARANDSSRLWQGKKRIVTLFLTDPATLVPWWQKNKIPCEYLFISHYPRNNHTMHQNWNWLFSQFKDYLGTGFGEVGMESWVTRKSINKKSVMEYYVHLKPKADNYVGGVFWWDWQEDHELWNKVNSP